MLKKTKKKKYGTKKISSKNTEMQMVSVNKSQFAGLNDKRYDFSEGSFFFLWSSANTSYTRRNKRIQRKIHKIVQHQKFDLLKMKALAVTNCKRLLILRSVLLQWFTYFKIHSKKRPNLLKKDFTTTKYYILNSHWLQLF